MNAVEADLDGAGELSKEVYLDPIAQRALPAVSLLNNVCRLQIFKGFLIVAAPDDANGNSDNERTVKRSSCGLPASCHCRTETVEGFITNANQEQCACVFFL